MPGMKRDCGGAAAILGAFKAAVKQVKNPHSPFSFHVIGVQRILGGITRIPSGV